MKYELEVYKNRKFYCKLSFWYKSNLENMASALRFGLKFKDMRPLKNLGKNKKQIGQFYITKEGRLKINFQLGKDKENGIPNLGSEAMKKRRESGLVTSCLGYLQNHVNLGHIWRVERLNSGSVRIGGGRCPFCKKVSQGRNVRLCSAGTPDIMVILNNGLMVWIECKTEKGELSTEQIEFQQAVNIWENHIHITATSVDCVRKELKKLGVDII